MKQRSLFVDACRSVRPVVWMLLCVPVLLALLAFDRLLPEYGAILAEHEDYSLRLQRVQVQADALPRYREHIEANQNSYQSLSSKAYTADNAEQSGSQLSSDLTRILAAVYIQPDAPVQVSVPQQQADAALLQADISFNCVPQQLQALELQLLAQPRLIKVTSVVAKVGPDALRGSQQLLVQLTLQAIHLGQPGPQTSPQTAKPTS